MRGGGLREKLVTFMLVWSIQFRSLRHKCAWITQNTSIMWMSFNSCVSLKKIVFCNHEHFNSFFSFWKQQSGSLWFVSQSVAWGPDAEMQWNEKWVWETHWPSWLCDAVWQLCFSGDEMLTLCYISQCKGLNLTAHICCKTLNPKMYSNFLFILLVYVGFKV